MKVLPKIEKRQFDAPDEIRDAGIGKGELLAFGDVSLMRITLPAGWQWSRHVKPLVRTESCQAQHLQYVLSGHAHVVMDDGSELDLRAGDVALVPAGHDAWVVGPAPFVAIDVTASDKWAQESLPNGDGSASYTLRLR